MIHLNRSETQLNRAAQDLVRRWDATAPHWRDQARAAFEKDFLEPLLPAAKNAARAMADVTQFLEQARRECG